MKVDLADISALENSIVNNQSQRYGSSKILEFNLETDQSLIPQRKSNVGFATDINFNDKMDKRNSNKSLASKTMPNMEIGRNGSIQSPNRSVTSDYSKGSRGGMTPSTAKSSMSGEGSATLIGVTNILILRLKGEVFLIDTVRDIIERNQSQKNNTIIDHFIVPPNLLNFIPPVAFESDYNPNKGKINISTIKGRDKELRNISETVISELFKDVLNTNSTVDYLLATLSGSNEKCIPLRGVEKYDQKSQITYGVYFNEIKDVKPLHYRMIAELKYKGYFSYYEEDNNKVKLLEETLSPMSVTLQWTKDQLEYIMTDEFKYSLTLETLREALRECNVTSLSSPSLFNEINKQ